MHGVARGRGDGWRSAIGDAFEGIPDTSNDKGRVAEEQKDNGHNNAATMMDKDTLDKDKEMEKKGRGQQNKGTMLGNEASRKAVEEYKDLIKSIMTWEIVVEKKEENLQRATNEEERKRLGEI
jgi:hypothetical protein